MDIGALGTYYLDNARFSPGAGTAGLGNTGGAGPAANPAGLLSVPGPETGRDFAGMLEKALAGEASPGPLSPVDRKPQVDKTSKLYEQCEALETFLVKTLLTGMRNTVQKSGLLDGGFAGDIYEDMLYDEYAKSYSKNANFGLAELAYLELTGQRGKVINR
ncbi:MAG: rod-binding protein [Treponema sp.]|nr:rod-binding protein [Treponema sp.]